MKLESWEWSKRTDFRPMATADAAARRREAREADAKIPTPSIPGVPREFAARNPSS